jgi:hypothetical protein
MSDMQKEEETVRVVQGRMHEQRETHFESRDRAWVWCLKNGGTGRHDHGVGYERDYDYQDDRDRDRDQERSRQPDHHHVTGLSPPEETVTDRDKGWSSGK